MADAPEGARDGTPWLRVAIVTRAIYPLHGYGGLERHTATLVRHLRMRGVGVTVITRPPAASFTTTVAQPIRSGRQPGDPWLSFEWVPYWTFPGAGRRGTTILDRSTAYLLFGLRAGRRAARLALGGEVDLVYGHGASVLGYARARLGVTGRPAAPLVFNPHGLEEFAAPGSSLPGARLKRLAYHPLQRAVLTCARAADRVIATDRALLPMIEGHLHVRRDEVRIVPNAVDLDDCDRLAGPSDGHAVRAAEGIAGDEPVLLSVGRIEANKGFHLLAASLAPLGHLAWRWVLVGEGPYRRQVEQALERHHLRNRVLFPGRIDDRMLHAWYEAATLFVHPTLYEGSSLVTLEAMAHARAVVGTKAGGLPDKIRHGTTGWLVDPGDATAMTAAIAEALGDLPRLTPMGLAGRRVVEQSFAWPVVTEQLLAVFREVLDLGGS